MGERIIGIVGIALAIIFGVLPFSGLAIPIWLIFIGIGIGILLLGVALGAHWFRSINATNNTIIADKALLRLHIYDDYRIPDCIEMENVFRWYYLSYYLRTRDETGNVNEFQSPTLFLSFSPDVKVTTLKVRSPDVRLPMYEVKEFNQKFAVIIFREKIQSGTLEISVE